jgi:hypothetical protein
MALRTVTSLLTSLGGPGTVPDRAPGAQGALWAGGDTQDPQGGLDPLPASSPAQGSGAPGPSSRSGILCNLVTVGLHPVFLLEQSCFLIPGFYQLENSI